MFGSLPRIWIPRRHASLGPALTALFVTVTPSASAGPPRTWTDAADRLLARIHQASGLVTDDFACCQTMAAGEFVTLAEEALREAQLWMLCDRGPRGLKPLAEDAQSPKDTRLSPYYWAPFVLSGDWR